VTDVQNIRSPLNQLAPSVQKVPEMQKGLFADYEEPFIADTEVLLKPRFYCLYRDNGDGSYLESAAMGGVLGLRSGFSPGRFHRAHLPTPRRFHQS